MRRKCKEKLEKLSCEIANLSSKVNLQGVEIWKLKNPPKYKVGDELEIITYTRYNIHSEEINIIDKIVITKIEPGVEDVEYSGVRFTFKSAMYNRYTLFSLINKKEYTLKEEAIKIAKEDKNDRPRQNKKTARSKTKKS